MNRNRDLLKRMSTKKRVVYNTVELSYQTETKEYLSEIDKTLREYTFGPL